VPEDSSAITKPIVAAKAQLIKSVEVLIFHIPCVFITATILP
jgi:hypothetical protein